MSEEIQLNLFEDFILANPLAKETTPATASSSKNRKRQTKPITVQSRPFTPVDEEPPKDRDRLVCYAGHRILITDRELTLEEIRQQLERDFPELSKERVVWHWIKPETTSADGQELAGEDSKASDETDPDMLLDESAGESRDKEASVPDIQKGAGEDAPVGQETTGLGEETTALEPIIIVPVVTAGKKGLGDSISQAVRGFHWAVAEMLADPRPIQVLAARDGIYEVRRTPAGLFSVRLDNLIFLGEWREGIILQYPKIPAVVLNTAIKVFRERLPNEAVALIVWQSHNGQYAIEMPHQEATRNSVSYRRRGIEEWLDPDRTLVMEIHSHGYWDAYFSETDNADELATGLYAVVGRLQADRPQLQVRYSCGGQYREIAPGHVFNLEGIEIAAEAGL